MRRLLHFTIVSMFAVVGVQGAFACTILPMPKPAARSFVLKLKGDQRGGGIRVSLKGPVTREQVTDARGEVEFRTLPNGMYTLTAPGIFGWDFIEVKAGGAPAVDIDWPQIPLLITRSVAGNLNDGIHPIAPHELILTDAASGRAIARTRNTADGNFAFGGQPAGSYVLLVKGRDKRDWLEGPILLTVDPKSPVASLDVQVGGSSCGLSYAPHCASPISVPDVSGLEGRVTDVTGGVITGAHVLVSTENISKRELATDNDGRFELGMLADGKYSLRVIQSGFASFSTEITVRRTSESGHLDIGMSPLMAGCKNTAEFHKQTQAN